MHLVAAISYIGTNRPPPKPLHEAQMGGAFFYARRTPVQPPVLLSGNASPVSQICRAEVIEEEWSLCDATCTRQSSQ